MNFRAISIVLFYVLVAAAGMGFSTTCWAGEEDLRVLSADEYGLILELTPPPVDMEPFHGQERSYQKFSLRGWAATSLPGRPELPVKGVLLHAPAGGDIRVEVLENNLQVASDRIIAPVPTLRIGEDGQAGIDYAEDDNVYHSSEFFPGIEAEISSRGVLRGVTVARLMLYPYRWNPMTGELQCSKRMRIKVQFEDPLPARAATSLLTADPGPESAYDDLLRNSIINCPPRGMILKEPSIAPQGTSLSQSTPTSLRIEVKQDGIYRLSYGKLKSAGVTLSSIDPTTFQLFNRGSEVAIRMVSKAEDRFRPGDCIEFYGQGINNTYTDTNIYWLSWGKELGKRAAAVDGKPTDGTLLSAFYSKLHEEQNHLMWGATPGAPQADHWFWEKLLAPKKNTYSINIPAPTADSADAVVRVCYRGYTTVSPHPNHHTLLSLNGSPIGDVLWDSDVEFIQEVQISQLLLIDGANNLTIEAPGDTGAASDEVLLNWIEVEYWRRFEALENELTATVQADGRRRIEVRNLQSRKVGIYDITDPLSMKYVTGFRVNADKTMYKATFEDDLTGGKRYLVLTNDRIRAPDHWKLWRTANLKNTDNRVDYLLITPREFLPAAKPLIRFRSSRQLKARAVAVEDIYNEFNYGMVDPQAIKDFLSYAYHSWKRPAPTYVLLLGDATYDYRDYLETGKKSRVPVHLGLTSQMGLTPDDNWYVALEGDDVLPEMFIGRISSSSSEQAAEVVQKVLGYEQTVGYQPRKALFVADNNDPAFESLNEGFIKVLPSGFDAHRVYLSSYGSVDKATRDIISHLDDGMLLTTYVGHGDLTHWAGEGLFVPSDIQSLNNGDKLSFVITLNCLNGYFAYPYYYSLGEEFLVAPDKGAIAAFSPSGLGYGWEHQILGDEVFSSIFVKGARPLGAITTQSKINAYARGVTQDLVSSFTLLGDPATRLRMAE